MTYTLAELAARVGAEVSGDGSIEVRGVATLEEAGPEHVSFLSNRKYRKAFENTQAGAVVVGRDEDVPPGRAALRAMNPQLAFARITTLFHPPSEPVPLVAEEAYVHPTARVDASAEVMPLAYVGADAVVGARCILFPGAYVGPGARLGDDCVLWPNAVVRDRCTLGNRVILQPGAIVGSDGFGFVFDPEGEAGSGPRHYKVPQVGTAVVEDDVELGANTCVDRAALGRTVVGRGTKVDNLVQIAHNVQVGELSILCAQVGIAGSTRLGRGVVAAGQVGIVGHITIHDGAKLGAQCGIMNDVEPGTVVFGTPARPKGEALRSDAVVARLPELVKRVKELERKIQELEAKR